MNCNLRVQAGPEIKGEVISPSRENREKFAASRKKCSGRRTHDRSMIIWKSVQWFLTRRFLKFSIEIYKENKPHHLAAMFFDESKWLEQSW